MLLINCRYEKQLEQEEQAYQQQRRRLYAEVQEEKERLADQVQRAKQETLQEKNANEVSGNLQSSILDILYSIKTLKNKSGVDRIIVRKQPYHLLNTNREFFPSFDTANFHKLDDESS